MNPASIRRDTVSTRLNLNKCNSQFYYHMKKECYKGYTLIKKLSKHFLHVYLLSLSIIKWIYYYEIVTQVKMLFFCRRHKSKNYKIRIIWMIVCGARKKKQDNLFLHNFLLFVQLFLVIWFAKYNKLSKDYWRTLCEKNV